MTAAPVIVTSTWFEAKAINSWNMGYQAMSFNDLAPTQIRGTRFFLLLTAQSEPDWAGFVDSKYARQLSIGI